MKLRHLAAAIAILAWTAMIGTSGAADNSDTGTQKSGQNEENMTEMRFGGPSLSWAEVLREGSRARTVEESGESLAQTEEESSRPNYFPEQPEDLTEQPPPLDENGSTAAEKP
jgi:hypothetical protein